MWKVMYKWIYLKLIFITCRKVNGESRVFNESTVTESDFNGNRTTYLASIFLSVLCESTVKYIPQYCDQIMACSLSTVILRLVLTSLSMVATDVEERLRDLPASFSAPERPKTAPSGERRRIYGLQAAVRPHTARSPRQHERVHVCIMAQTYFSLAAMSTAG